MTRVTHAAHAVYTSDTPEYSQMLDRATEIEKRVLTLRRRLVVALARGNDWYDALEVAREDLARARQDLNKVREQLTNAEPALKKDLRDSKAARQKLDDENRDLRAEVRFLVFAAHTGSTHSVCLHGIPYTASGPCPSCSYYRTKHGLNPGHPTPAQEDAEMAAALKAAHK